MAEEKYPLRELATVIFQEIQKLIGIGVQPERIAEVLTASATILLRMAREVDEGTIKADEEVH